MDLLCKAYSNTSDDEDSDPPNLNQPLAKRPKYEYSIPVQNPHPNYHPVSRTLNPPTGASGAGRYISKRERALMNSNTAICDPNLVPAFSIAPSPVLGSISDSDVPHDILSLLRQQRKGNVQKGRITQRISVALNAYKKPVNAIHWAQRHAHLLASAGMDNTVNIWNIWSKGEKKARVFNYHTAAVKDVKWSPQGQCILSCGYDCSSRLVDIESGIQTQVFIEDQAVTTIKFQPDEFNLFLSGGEKGLLKLWDIRTGKAVHEYIRRLGPILDVEFTSDSKQFISSTDNSKSNVSENSIIVWDVSREVPLSNQVYVEAYTCPSVRCHPFEPFFVAQSNGNYIAIFSTKHPYKMDKYKRYESHGVFGFPIKCNFSPDGETLASGSSDGNVYLYNVKSSNFIRKITAHDEACVDVAFHPFMPNVIASCSWNGNISVSVV